MSNFCCNLLGILLCPSTIFVRRSADITWCVGISSFSIRNMWNPIHHIQTAACSTKREKCSTFSVAPFTLIALLLHLMYKWVYNTSKCWINLGNMLKVGRNNPSDEVQSHPKIEAILLVGSTHPGKLFIHIGPTFLWQNYSASIYLTHFKFGTVKDIFMVNNSMVLDFLFFCIFGGKMSS